MGHHLSKEGTKLLIWLRIGKLWKRSCPCPFCRVDSHDPPILYIPRLPSVAECPSCKRCFGFGDKEQLQTCINCQQDYRISASGADFDRTGTNGYLENARAKKLPDVNHFSYKATILLFGKCPSCNDFQWIRILGYENSGFTKLIYRFLDNVCAPFLRIGTNSKSWYFAHVKRLPVLPDDWNDASSAALLLLKMPSSSVSFQHEDNKSMEEILVDQCFPEVCTLLESAKKEDAVRAFRYRDSLSETNKKNNMERALMKHIRLLGHLKKNRTFSYPTLF